MANGSEDVRSPFDDDCLSVLIVLPASALARPEKQKYSFSYLMSITQASDRLKRKVASERKGNSCFQHNFFSLYHEK